MMRLFRALVRVMSVQDTVALFLFATHDSLQSLESGSASRSIQNIDDKTCYRVQPSFTCQSRRSLPQPFHSLAKGCIHRLNPPYFFPTYYKTNCSPSFPLSLYPLSAHSGRAMASSLSHSLTLVSPLNPPSLSRAWLTAIHPSLPWVATCASDKIVRVYSLTSFTQLSAIAGGHKRSVRTCAWKPGSGKEGSTLATGSFDASVGVWRKEEDGPSAREVDFTGGEDAGNGEEREEDEDWRFALVLDGHDSEVKSVSWSAGGTFLATCSRDKSVWIWEEVGEDDFETIAVLQEHEGDVKYVVWHPEEELLASASYDDDVRLWREDIDDWGCVAVLRGHETTVWMCEWEGVSIAKGLLADTTVAGREEWIKRKEASGPRLVTCSDDLSIRIWRRRPKEKEQEQNRLSIIRTGSMEEDWIEEARLPKRHERPIYAVSWSKKSGRIVSTGGDGKIVVFEERWVTAGNRTISESNGKNEDTQDEKMNDASEGNKAPESDTESMNGSVTGTDSNSNQDLPMAATEWVVIAEKESAHGVFELNHVIWTRRGDKNRRGYDEEVILSTGDDGVVNVWALDA